MPWINFQELRDKLDFRTVLEHYGVRINAKNHVQHHGPCPFPTHEGKPRSPSFSANLDKRIFRCFGCGAQGNILDFACRMEKLDPARPEDVRKTALLLAERYGIASTLPKPSRPPATSAKPRPAARMPVFVNAPMDFSLKGLDPDHQYLLGRGFTKETIAHFELGYASRGLMQGRIAIPLRNPKGELIGYAGRIVDDSLITGDNPKYRFPSARDHEGKRYDFCKSLFLYNGNAIETPAENLIIVEGFPSVWWLWQCQFAHTVGLMASTSSPEQALLIVGMVPRRGRIWIMTDGNQAGRYCAETLFKQLAPYRFVRWVELKDDRKPTDLKQDEIRSLLE